MENRAVVVSTTAILSALLVAWLWRATRVKPTVANATVVKREDEQPVRLEKKSANESRTVMHELLIPEHADPRGIAFGGVILAWIDVCAGIAAKRHAGQPAVTASVDAVHFLSPLRVGDLCILKAKVNRSWNSSMEVGVKVEGEDLTTGVRRFCCHAYLTFVCVSPEGRPQRVCELVPETEDEIRRWEEADQRRGERIASKKRRQAEEASTAAGEPAPALLLKRPSDPRAELLKKKLVAEMSEDEDSVTVRRSAVDQRWCKDSITECLQLVFPEHANSLQITFGGQIMKWMDYCAVMAASRHCRSQLLTASLDSIQFLSPTKIGDTIIVRGIVSMAFEHSVEVYVTVEKEDLRTNKVILTNEGYLTLAAVDQKGSLVKVPRAVAVSERERALQKGAHERKRDRLAGKAQLHHV
ncbi:HotDog domain-containing protein [Cladochytrium replicatum]|nr:HotDog domain-containing protein [Cladochytrium replicatum]